MSAIAFACLWITVFVIPWELFLEFPGFGTLGRLVGVAAFAFFAVDLVSRGTVRPLRPFHIVVLAFVAWSGVSVFWTIDPIETRERFFSYLQLALFVWLVWELAPTRARQESLLQAYVLGAYVSVIDTVVKFLSGASVETGRFAATGFNPNDLGFTLVLGLPIAWYLVLARDRGPMLWVNRLYLPAGMAAILLTASRGSFVAGIVALTVVPLTVRQGSVRTRIVLTLLVGASLVGLARFVPATSWERLASTSDQIEAGSFSNRGEIWAAGLEVFVENPMLGVGAGGFGAAVTPLLGSPRGAHQTFLAVAVGQGAIGVALFLLLFPTSLMGIGAMPVVQRRFWLVLFCTLAIGLQPRTWDYRKPVWFLLGTVAAQADAARRARAARRAPDHAPPPLAVGARAHAF